MLARLVRELPLGDHLLYEPKWDGFRTIVFRNGDDLLLASRNERDMTRYFPELQTALLRELPPRIVLDGEVVIVTPRGLDFEALLIRVHPASSRIDKLARQTPASFVAFDILGLGETDLRPRRLGERRRLLESALEGVGPPVHLTPASTDASVAREWFRRYEGAGIDGVIAKSLALGYIEGRRAMFKLKHERSADCVVAGFRDHANGGVGSLLLGLHDDRGRLHHVGIASGFSARQRRELLETLAPLRRDAEQNHPWLVATGESEIGEARRPGGTSRWSRARDLTWQPLRPERVAEVRYDHLQGDRFRHATHFSRWRPDREPRSCTYSQLESVGSAELATLLGGTELPSSPLKKRSNLQTVRSSSRRRSGPSSSPVVARILRMSARSTFSSKGDTSMQNLQDLFVHEIKDLYSAEKQLVKALPKMARAAASEDLSSAIDEHLGQTEEHVARLEQILADLDASTRGPKCKGMEGLLAEGQEILEVEISEDVIDAAWDPLESTCRHASLSIL